MVQDGQAQRSALQETYWTSIQPAPAQPGSAYLGPGLYNALMGGAQTFGQNLHRVHVQEMTMGQALASGTAQGIEGGVASALGMALGRTAGGKGLLGLVVAVGVAVGVGYIIHAARPQENAPDR